MDEPFRQLLARLPPTLAILIIEHDMDLAFGIADVVTVLDHGEVVFEGAPEAARASRLVKEIYLGSWSPHAGA
jgi:branched-chain amino acid transport system ATP-binding protein